MEKRVAEAQNALWQVQLPIKEFLLVRVLPLEWKPMDLYLIREGDVVFYVGQSACAFRRVWQHILAGPHGHSLVGRFVIVNWPRSAAWTVELLRSDSPRFQETGFDRDLAEQLLIEAYTPCLNIALNRQAVPLPEGCLPANAPLLPFHRLKRMLRESGYLQRAAGNDLEW